jgi:hypothetical protein
LRRQVVERVGVRRLGRAHQVLHRSLRGHDRFVQQPLYHRVVLAELRAAR